MSTISSYANTSLASALQDIQQKYKTADTSGNGTLSQAELTSAAQSSNDGLKTSDIATAFKQLDGDGNGELTETELSEGIELADQVQQALLVAQEIASGSMFLNILNGGSSSGTDISSLFGDDSDSSSSDYASTIAEIATSTYQATEDAVTAEITKNTTTA